MPASIPVATTPDPLSDLWRRHCSLTSYLPAQFSNGAGETGNILVGSDQLAVAEHERGGEGTVCGSECCHQCAIARGGGVQVFNGSKSFLPICMVGGLVVNMISCVVACTCGGGLRLAQFLVGGDEKTLKSFQVLSTGYRLFHCLQSLLNIPVWGINYYAMPTTCSGVYGVFPAAAYLTAPSTWGVSASIGKLASYGARSLASLSWRSAE